MAPPENSVTHTRADCALTHQKVGGVKGISPCVKSVSVKLFLDLHARSAILSCPRLVCKTMLLQGGTVPEWQTLS